MFNEIILVSVTPFSGSTDTDKNGLESVMLQLIAGKMPNRNVLSGTVAHRLGIKVGETYLMNVREQGEDIEFGQDFTFIKVKHLTEAEDIVRTSKELSPPVIVIINKPDIYDGSIYQRKTNAVEGLRTIRIKEGKYIPIGDKSNLEHKTAVIVKEGSSAESNAEITEMAQKGPKLNQ